MTRRVFGEQIQFHGSAGPSAQIKAYLAPTGGSPVEVADDEGEVLAGGVITLVNDVLPVFQGPDDGTAVLWLDTVKDTGDSRMKTSATDVLAPESAASVPVPEAGDAGKLLSVTAEEDGYELVAPEAIGGVTHFSYTSQPAGDWIEAYPVTWAGGPLTLPIPPVGEGSVPSGQEIDYQVVVGTPLTSEEATGFPAPIYIDRIDGVWNEYEGESFGNGIELAAGDYTVVFYVYGATEPVDISIGTLPAGLTARPFVEVESGTSVPDSRLSLLSFDAVDLTVGSATATGLTVDQTAGTDLTLDADGETVHVLTAGTYLVQASLNGTGDADEMSVTTDPALPGVGHGFGGSHKVDASQYVYLSAVVRLPVGDFTFGLGSTGASGADTSNGFFVDIIRLV